MKDLTLIEKEKLLAEVKSFLDITWDDDDVNKDVWADIVESIRWIDNLCGVEIDYLTTEETQGEAQYLSLCTHAYSLLKARVFYMREKAIDDFPKNYQNELTGLYIEGRAYASTL